MKKFGGKYPLIIEAYPEGYDKDFEFITLIRFNDENYLTIVDNLCNKQIITYVLDYCKPTNVNEILIASIAKNWFQTNKENYPISVEFSKMQIAKETQKIMRCFPIDYVSRVIGPVPEYRMDGPIKVKKRKRKPIPKGIEFINKSSKRFYD